MKQVERYIPEGSVRIHHKASSAVAYAYEVCGQPYAIMYEGKRMKPSQYFRFRSQEHRAKEIEKFFSQVQRCEARSIERKAEKKAEMAKGHGLQGGEIFVCSWGYEQTQVEFFQVTRAISATMVEVRRIKGEYEYTHAMQGYATPSPGEFCGEPQRKRVYQGRFKVHEFASAARYEEGRKCHFSEYY